MATNWMMQDSVTPSAIKTEHLSAVAGYNNGAYAWKAADWDKFEGFEHLGIDVNGDAWETSGALDIENGDATVQVAVVWVGRKLKAAKPGEYPPILYCNRNTLTPLFNAMNAAGYKVNKDFKLWIGTLDGTTQVSDMTGVFAVQYAGAKQLGFNVDESIIYDGTWRNLDGKTPVTEPKPPVVPPVTPEPPGYPVPPKGTRAVVVYCNATGDGVISEGVEWDGKAWQVVQ